MSVGPFFLKRRGYFVLWIFFGFYGIFLGFLGDLFLFWPSFEMFHGP